MKRTLSGAIKVTDDEINFHYDITEVGFEVASFNVKEKAQ